MIDFTTIQAHPIPPPILEIQGENLLLKNENEVLNNVLLILGIGIMAYLIIQTNKPLKFKISNADKYEN